MSFDDNNLSDVPIEGKVFQDHDQLPSAEDVKLERSASGHFQLATRRVWVCLSVAVVVLILIIGLSVGLTRKDESSKASTSASSGNPTETSTAKVPLKYPNTGNRDRDVLLFLADYGLSDKNLLLQPHSPQHKAYRFMADQTNMSLYNPNFLQRYAVMVIFLSLGVDSKIVQFSFGNYDSECSWHYHGVVGVFCNLDMQVEKLLLPGSTGKLNGTIPLDVGLLSQLTILDVDDNYIIGTFPETIVRLTDLKTLDISNNQLSGEIPQFGWNALSNLQKLYLGHNKFSGPIPHNFSSLSNLTALSLHHNALSGDVQLFSSMSALKRLAAENNLIHGSLDDNFFSSLSDLEEIFLGRNQIHSTIPQSIFTHPSLSVLDLNSNNFTGSIPNISPPSKLKTLSLYNNALTGSIPATIGDLKQIQFLDLSRNHLTSSFPSEIARLTDLTYLFIGSNTFAKGPIPEGFKHLTKLKELSLQETLRTGKIPDFIGSELTDLVLLDLSFNQLSGDLPESLNQLSLSFLLLNSNQLTGAVDHLNVNPAIDLILLENNGLTGSIRFCDGLVRPSNLTFIANCNDTQARSSQLGNCTCCSVCCTTLSHPCNSQLWVGNLEPSHDWDP